MYLSNIQENSKVTKNTQDKKGETCGDKSKNQYPDKDEKPTMDKNLVMDENQELFQNSWMNRNPEMD